MIRYLSAIGMSRYIDQKSLNGWLSEYLHSGPENVERYAMPGRDGINMEFYQDMGVFKLIIKAYMDTPGTLHVYSVLPAARAGTFSRLLNCKWGLEGACVYVWGEEEDTGGILEVLLARSGPVLSGQVSRAEGDITVSYTALSVEGKILLGIQKTNEDLALYEEEEQWRRDMLKKLRDGDEEALHELEIEALQQEQEITERMRHEDVFTVLEGLFVPADDVTTALYQVMGTILDVDKVLNAVTEEWVYHLQLDVMGSPLDVYIHPDDLVGIPTKGMRFMGKARMIGSVNEMEINHVRNV